MLRLPLLLGLLLAVALPPACVSPLHADDERPPNIVLIMADDLGYGALGCYGQTKVKTPHIDRLAAEGVRCTQAYAGCHVCQPSRSVLMTGLHTGHSAVRANDPKQMLLPEDVTIAEVLKQQGYCCGIFGKWGLGFEGTPGHPLRQGFDVHVGQLLQGHAHFYYPTWIWADYQKLPLPKNLDDQRGSYVEDVVFDAAMNFIRTSKSRPFFAYVAFITPHVELVVPKEDELPYRGKFPKIAMPDPRKDYIGSDDGLTTFAGMVSRMDRRVGEIVALIDELGLKENTLIIFTSDNGGQGGGRNNSWTKMTDYFDANGGLRGYKGRFHEGGIRVPFIARFPGTLPEGKVCEQVIGFHDVLPTLADFAGAPPPQDIDGHSVRHKLKYPEQEPAPRKLYWEYPRSTGLERATRVGDWKLIHERPDAKPQLYNLADDPSETTNVAEDHPDVVTRLLHHMATQHEDIRDYPRQNVQHSAAMYKGDLPPDVLEPR